MNDYCRKEIEASGREKIDVKRIESETVEGMKWSEMVVEGAGAGRDSITGENNRNTYVKNVKMRKG